MSAAVSTPQHQNSAHLQPNTTLQNTTLNLRKAMKRLFRSTSNSATNTTTTTTTISTNPTKIVITPTSEESKTRSRLSYGDDCGSSRRGKSLDGRPSLDPSPTNGLATSSVIHLGLPAARSEEGPPPSPSKLQPPSSFRSKFRPKSLQALKTRGSSDNGSTRHGQRQLVRNPSSESPPPPLPHVNAVPSGNRPPQASTDESSKAAAASIVKENPQPQPFGESLRAAGVNGSSSETQHKAMADAKSNSTSASERMPVETRSHVTSVPPPPTSTTAMDPSSDVLGILNASYSKTLNPRVASNEGTHMAVNIPSPTPPAAAPLQATASFTDGPFTAEPVEQMSERQEDDQKQQQLRQDEHDVVAAPRSASGEPADLTSQSTSDSPSIPPPSSTHRRPGSDEFQRPRAFTTGDAAMMSSSSSSARMDSSSPPPSAVSTSSKSGLRLRVDSSALPPRLPSLPMPSTSEFSALASASVSVSPTSTTAAEVGALNA
ncbi:hypothetical protein M407DRAFT_34775, partial [Tulasnella calospora MUT 4182]